MQFNIFQRITFFLFIWFLGEPSTASFEPAAQKITATTFSDEEKEEIGKKMASITSQGVNQANPDQPLDNNHAGAIMTGLQQIPPPKLNHKQGAVISQRIGYDPPVSQSPDICERDYSQLCPETYLEIGDALGNGSLLCSPGPLYDGPCAGSFVDPTKMSKQTKRAWATRCVTNWPCNGCKRHFGKLCPEGWKQKEGTLHECESTEDYRGPCIGYDMNFDGFNAEMKRKWSDKCLAWWPCVSPIDEQASLGPDIDVPISRKATIWRIQNGYQ